MKARPEKSSGADPQGAVARAEAWRADEDRLAEVVAEARLVERARIVKWLPKVYDLVIPSDDPDGHGGSVNGALLAAIEGIDAGAHLVDR